MGGGAGDLRAGRRKRRPLRCLTGDFGRMISAPTGSLGRLRRDVASAVPYGFDRGPWWGPGTMFPRSAAYPYGGRSICAYISEEKRQRAEKWSQCHILARKDEITNSRGGKAGYFLYQSRATGGQGTIGPLRRFFGNFLSAGGKKVTLRSKGHGFLIRRPP